MLPKVVQKAAVLLKIVPEAGHECTLDKSNRPKRAKRKPDQKFVGALEQVLELVSVFQDVSRSFFNIYFSLEQQKQGRLIFLKTICVCTENTIPTGTGTGTGAHVFLHLEIPVWICRISYMSVENGLDWIEAIYLLHTVCATRENPDRFRYW
jgi:hypothetical protein